MKVFSSSSRWFWLFLMAAVSFPPAVLQAGEPPKEKRIVFLGDSITQAGGYVQIIEAALIAAQPEVVREIIPLGLSSETVSGLSEKGHAGGQFPRPDLHERLDRVLAKTKPELVLACYGMNDGIYYPPDADRTRAFQDGMEKLHRKVIAAGARMIHLTPPVFDPLPIKDRVLPDGLTEYPQPWRGYNRVLDQYSAWLLGKRAEGWEVLDIHGPMNAALAERRRQDPNFTFAGDGVHAGPEGHVLMARPVLEAWGLKIRPDGSPDVAGGSAILEAVRKKYAILSPAWLSETGHLRPGIQPGLPLPEAQAKAAAFDSEARRLAVKARAGAGTEK
jgi:lysophospholipase L1-like esterase